jgi:hypothetical protein
MNETITVQLTQDQGDPVSVRLVRRVDPTGRRLYRVYVDGVRIGRVEHGRQAWEGWNGWRGWLNGDSYDEGSFAEPTRAKAVAALVADADAAGRLTP